MTYKDYLAQRGYKPLAFGNSGEDLWTIFCCYASLYAFVMAFVTILMKFVMRGDQTSAALYTFALIFFLMAGLTIFGIGTNNLTFNEEELDRVETKKAPTQCATIELTEVNSSNMHVL